jgi:hypothetical protein
MDRWSLRKRDAAVVCAALLIMSAWAWHRMSELPQTALLPAPTVSGHLVSLDSLAGKQLLLASTASEAFLPLSIHFETQDDQTSCGPTSIAMVLNAMGIPRPEMEAFQPFGLYTQHNVLADGSYDPDLLARVGMPLEAIGRVLRSHGVEARHVYASTTSLDAFRRQVSEALSTPGTHVIANYSRTVLGQEGSGHISPLAGYNETSDMVLILDVARYKSPPVWVPTATLWEAMTAPVSAGGPSRGFVLVDAQSL